MTIASGRDSRYADMYPELLALMQRFELCYKLLDSQPKIWLAPQLLPPAKPDALKGWGSVEDLVLYSRYDFMPKGLVSRLTVQLHRCNSKICSLTSAISTLSTKISNT